MGANTSTTNVNCKLQIANCQKWAKMQKRCVYNTNGDSCMATKILNREILNTGKMTNCVQKPKDKVYLSDLFVS